MGTYDAKFTIPDLGAEQGVADQLGGAEEPAHAPNAAVFSAEKDKKLYCANPLVQDGKKLVPSVTRVFNKSQHMFVYLEAYEPAADTTQPLVASVTFFRGKTLAFQTAPLEVTKGLTKNRRRCRCASRAHGQARARPLYLPGKRAAADGAEFAFWRAQMMLVQ